MPCITNPYPFDEKSCRHHICNNNKSPKPDASKGNTRNASPNVSSKKKGKPKAPADGKKAKKTKTPKQR